MRGTEQRWSLPAAVAAGVLAVRAAVLASGNGFSTGYLDRSSMWQLIDPVALERNPFAPVWDMHTQPPLFNVLVGVVSRWSPLSEALSFQVLFLAAGVVGAVAVAEVLRLCGCRSWVAGLAAVLVFSSPVVIGYELAVSHEPIVTPLLACATWAVASYAHRPTVGRLAAFAACATSLVLIRPLFHPLWFVLAVGVVVVMRPPLGDRRRVLAVVALPLVVAGVLVVKNQVRFDEPSLSSWSGMNLARTTVFMLDDGEVEELIAAGDLSPQARVGPFGPYEDLAPYAGPCTSDFGTPILDSTEKADGSPNFNAACYVPVYQQSGRDALAAIRHRPLTYVQALGANATLFAGEPGRSSHGLDGWAVDVLEGVHRVIGADVRVTSWYPNGWRFDVDLHLTVVVAIVGLVVAGIRSLARRARGAVEPVDVVLAFVGSTVAVLTLASVLLDAFESSRFRAPLDPLIFGAALGVVLEAGARAVTARSRATAHSRAAAP